MELVLAIIACIFVAQIAEISGKSPIIWGAITFVFYIFSNMLPLPFLRVLIVVGLSIAAMTVSNFFKK